MEYKPETAVTLSFRRANGLNLKGPMAGRDTVTIESDEDLSQLVFERFELCVLTGPNAGLCKTFGQQEVQVGSAHGNDLMLTDPTVSRFHLRIENRSGKLMLIDMGSTNGTYVRGLRVEAAHLSTEIPILVGGTTVRFRPLDDLATVAIPQVDHLGPIIGKSPRMRLLYGIIQRAAGSDIPVIVEGETGTGKDLVARQLHDMSPRAKSRFEVLDCTTVPDELLESELFGHVRGAFTGADRDRHGIFERAHGGTVFIDEIGEVKPELQPKLLRVLETRQVRRVGGDSAISVNVRVVAATHRSLIGMVNTGRFREDLYFRLAGCRIDLPPLRERVEDIPLLVAHFIETLRRTNKQDLPETLDPDTMDQLKAKPWPGNVRQLKNAVARMAVLGPQAGFLEDDGLARSAAPAEANAASLPLRTAKEDFERSYLVDLLAQHDGDLKAAAAAAHLHPKSLARLLRRYSIDRT